MSCCSSPATAAGTRAGTDGEVPGRRNSLVAGIDITHYLRRTAAANSACIYSAGDLQGLGQALEAKYGYDHYVEPVLIGYSSGATLAYGALVQGPPEHPLPARSPSASAPTFMSPKPMCKGAGLTHTEDPKHMNTYLYDKAASTPSPWIAFQGEVDRCATPQATKTFVDGIANASLVSLPNVGHGFSVEKNWMPQFKDSFQHIVHRNTAMTRSTPSRIPLPTCRWSRTACRTLRASRSPSSSSPATAAGPASTAT